MTLADAIMAGLRLRQHIDSASDEAAKRQATVKLLKAQADGEVASAALHRQKFDQVAQHQARLLQAFTQGQGPEPLPEGVPQGIPPGPQARLQQELSPQASDVPPEPVWNRASGVGVLPSPQQEAAGFTQRFQGQDEQGRLQAFARRYGPAQPQEQAIVSTPLPLTATPEASHVPQVAASPAGETGETPRVRVGATALSGGSSAVPQPIPQGTGDARTPLQMPAARVTATGPDDTQLLRNLSKVHFMNNQPKEALAIFQYATEQQNLRNLARVYREVLDDTHASEPQRRIALAGLGQALIQASKVEAGMGLLMDQLPMRSRQVIEQAGVETRNVLLEQAQTGQPLDVAAANQEATRRKDASTLATRAPREPRAPETQVVETEQGIFVVEKSTGQARQVTMPGTGASPTPGSTPQTLPGKKMTEVQAKAYSYGSRGLQANTILNELEAKGMTGQNFAAQLAEQGPAVGGAAGALAGVVLGIYTGGLGFAGVTAGTAIGAGLGIALAEPLANMLRTPEEKLYAQARLDFLATVLRKESGAAITLSEAAREEQRYFPRTGDTPAVVAQKRQARLQVLATLATEAGRPLALPQAPPAAQTPADAGLGQVGNETVRLPPVRQAPAARQVPQRQVPESLSSLLVQMSPEVILQVSDAALEGVQSPSDVPGLSVSQQRALIIRLQRRAQQQPR